MLERINNKINALDRDMQELRSGMQQQFQQTKYVTSGVGETMSRTMTVCEQRFPNNLQNIHEAVQSFT